MHNEVLMHLMFTPLAYNKKILSLVPAHLFLSICVQLSFTRLSILVNIFSNSLNIFKAVISIKHAKSSTSLAKQNSKFTSSRKIKEKLQINQTLTCKLLDLSNDLEGEYTSVFQSLNLCVA